MAAMQTVPNYINGEWREPAGLPRAEVINPATGQVIALVSLSGKDEVDQAAQAASAALPGWRSTPAQERVQYLFKLRRLLEDHLDEISRTITNECGKTYEEAKAEMRRAIENVEIACGIPMMAKGEISEDIAPGIDEIMLRQPVGVCATIAPFNFPGMIPFWYLPYALACGNTYIVKPSEKVPMTMQLVFQLIEQLGLPKGRDQPGQRGQRSRGCHPGPPGDPRGHLRRLDRNRPATSTAARGENGKRVQAQGGAKNPVIVLPDADMDMATASSPTSAFGCAGQRCLAVSLAVTVGEARSQFAEMHLRCRRQPQGRLRAGCRRADGPGDQCGQQSADRAADRRWAGQEGAGVAGGWARSERSPGTNRASFVRPTILLDVPQSSEICPDGNLWPGAQPDARQYDR